MTRGETRFWEAGIAWAGRGVERMVLFRPSPRHTPTLLWLLAGLLGLAFLVRARLGEALTVDLFLLPVLLAPALFRLRGLSVVAVAAAAYYVSGILCPGLDNRHLLLNTLGQVGEWSVLATLELLTLDRYSRVRALQARVKSDLELARRLQSALMRPSFGLGKVRLVGEVSQTHDVGGDFYYFRPFGQKYVVFCLGDVMGKGIAASLLMAMVMSFLFEWGKKSTSPAVVLRKLNQRLTQTWDQSQSSFLTMFYGVYDEATGLLTYANAGHPAGLLLRRGGLLEELEGTGLPVGIFDEQDWTEGQVTLQAGDRLMLCSDGLLEAKDPEGREYGVEGAVASLRSLVGRPLDSVLREVKEKVTEHAHGTLSDDLSLLLLEVS